MTTVTSKDGTEIYYKDWGPKDAQPIVFPHGWPLSSDEWDAWRTATASWPTTAAGTVGPHRSREAMTWTTMPSTPRPSPSIST